MDSVKQEIMRNLFRQLLAHLESKDCEEDFISIVELPLVEAVMNHCDGDIKRASKALKISENSLANKLRRDFGTKDIGKYQVLLRKMRGRYGDGNLNICL